MSKIPHGTVARLVELEAGFRSEYLELDGIDPTWTERQAEACVFDSYDEACNRALALKRQHPEQHYFPLVRSGLTDEEIARRRRRQENRIANTEPDRASTSPAAAKRGTAAKGLARDGHKPLMRNRQPGEASPTGIAAGDTLL